MIPSLVGSCPDASVQSNEALVSELLVSEYAKDIHQHLRESEVRNHSLYIMS